MSGRILAAALMLALPAFALPPASPPVDTAMPHGPGHVPADMVLPLKTPMPAELPKKGKVLTLIATDSYAFIEVEAADGRQWIAAPVVPMQVGDRIGYSDGSVMHDFYSKTLQRSFASLLFADHVAVLPAGK